MFEKLLTLSALFALGCGGSPTPLTNKPPAKKIVFLTSAVYSGDLKTVSGGATGAAAGDALCTTAGTAALLGSSWKAWLSDSTANAIDRIEDVGPWVLTTGQTAFNNKANLATTALVPIDADENGHVVPGSTIDGTNGVWTGTQTGGIRDGNFQCIGWGNVNGQGAIGDFTGLGDWTRQSEVTCDGTAGQFHLYCLQQ